MAKKYKSSDADNSDMPKRIHKALLFNGKGHMCRNIYIFLYIWLNAIHCFRHPLEVLVRFLYGQGGTPVPRSTVWVQILMLPVL